MYVAWILHMDVAWILHGCCNESGAWQMVKVDMVNFIQIALVIMLAYTGI